MGSKSKASKSKPRRRSKSSKTKKSSRLSKASRRSKTVRSKTKSKNACPRLPGKTLSTPKRKSKSKSKSKRMSRPIPKKVVSLADAKKIGHKLGINFKAVSPEEFRYGMNIEIEHGKQNKLTNVTNNDLLLTGKIALAHILEYPDYYVRLKKMETDAEKYWSKRRKPSMLVC